VVRNDRVFIGRDGRPMRGDALRHAFARARRQVAGVAGRFPLHRLMPVGGQCSGERT